MEGRVLVVDDDEQVCHTLQRLLEREGYSGMAAGDASEARLRLSEQKFDLVLCDVNMPGESGLDLVKHIVDECPETAIVMVTGVDEPAIAAVALETGAYGYVIKPFTHNEVIINVMNALLRRRLEIENRMHREQLVGALRERTAEAWTVINRLEKQDQKLQQSFEDTVRRLALAAELRDEGTARHIERMSRYAHLLAQRLGLPQERCELIRLASRMHDVGKIGVPDRVLRKRGQLTPAEAAIVRCHPEMGHRILAGSGAELLDLAASVAWTHHEKWDGSGYPRGLAGEEIPLEARIATVADIFDALASRRPYRQATPIGRTVEIMRAERGRDLDPAVLDAFLGSLEDMVAIAAEHADEASESDPAVDLEQTQQEGVRA